jgi:hypothetical protein
MIVTHEQMGIRTLFDLAVALAIIPMTEIHLH